MHFQQSRQVWAFKLGTQNAKTGIGGSLPKYIYVYMYIYSSTFLMCNNRRECYIISVA